MAESVRKRGGLTPLQQRLLDSFSYDVRGGGFGDGDVVSITIPGDFGVITGDDGDAILRWRDAVLGKLRAVLSSRKPGVEWLSGGCDLAVNVLFCMNELGDPAVGWRGGGVLSERPDLWGMSRYVRRVLRELGIELRRVVRFQSTKCLIPTAPKTVILIGPSSHVTFSFWEWLSQQPSESGERLWWRRFWRMMYKAAGSSAVLEKKFFREDFYEEKEKNDVGIAFPQAEQSS